MMIDEFQVTSGSLRSLNEGLTKQPRVVPELRLSKMCWFQFVALAMLCASTCIVAASDPADLSLHARADITKPLSRYLQQPFRGLAKPPANDKKHRKEGGWGATKPHAIVDCTWNDLEEIRQLLLATPEYPVKYGPSTMRSFARSERFFDMCVVAKEIKTTTESEAETEAETEGEDDRRALGRVVGVVGAAEMSRGSANILMVAVDKNFRRMGLAKTMMKAVLAKASRFSQDGNGGSVLNDTVLHVWISQLAPLHLYMSLGFGPSRYLPTYYSEQLVSAGYEMHLPLPYERIEDMYAAKIKVKEAKLKQLQQTLVETGANRRFHGSAERKGFVPTAYVNAVTSEVEITSALRTFLNGAAPKGSDPSAIMREIMGSALPQLSFVAVEPTADVSGAIWVQTPPKDGVIENIVVLVDNDEDGLTYLSLFDKLLTEASGMSEITAVRHKMYCDDPQSLIYMWKLGLHPTDFTPVPSRRRFGFPTYEYTTETKLPWIRNEELTLTRRSRLLDREIAHEEERLHGLLTGQPEPLPVPTELAPAPPVAPPGLSVSPAVPQAEPQPSIVQDTEQKKEESTIVPSPAEPQPIEAQKIGQPLRNGSSASMGGEAEASGELSPWYRTVAGVAGMIIGCTIVMFFCFRFCSRQRDRAPASEPQRDSSGTVEREMYNEDKGELQRRPTARKEGYSQVTDEQAVREPDSDSWWGQEDTDGGNQYLAD